MQTPDDMERVRYYAAQMEEGYRFMEEMMRYPVEECGEPLESLPDAVRAAGVDVEFSKTKIVNDLDRIFRLRRGLIEDFITLARAMNDRGWVLKVEDGFRSRQMQKLLGRKPGIFDAILQWTIRELNGEIPSSQFMFRRVASMVAARPKVGTHMSGSAIDISVLRRNDRKEIDRDGYYPELCERTPMNSPFISAVARHNRTEITHLMESHGFMTYPWEFWHYSKGDVYAEYFLKTGKPGRYGAVDWNPSNNSITPIANPLEPLNTDAEIQFEIKQSLQRIKRKKS
jgi:D-alanyl-D-alanine dipeptidase